MSDTNPSGPPRPRATVRSVGVVVTVFMSIVAAVWTADWVARLDPSSSLHPVLAKAFEMLGVDDTFRRNAVSSGFAAAILVYLLRYGEGIISRLIAYVTGGELLRDFLKPIAMLYVMVLSLVIGVPSAINAALSGPGDGLRPIPLDLTGFPSSIGLKWKGHVKAKCETAEPMAVRVDLSPESLKELREAMRITLDPEAAKALEVLVHLDAAESVGAREAKSLVDALDRLGKRIDSSLPPGAFKSLSLVVEGIAERTEGLAPRAMPVGRAVR